MGNFSKVDLQANRDVAKQDWKQPSDIALSAKFEDAAIIKKMDGGYAVRASFEGKDLGMKNIPKIDGVRYELMPAGAMKEQMLHDTVAHKFVNEVREIRKQQAEEHKGLKL